MSSDFTEQLTESRGQHREFAIRCFIDDERKYTHLLTKEEAASFRAAAQHLASYLAQAYDLDK